MFGSVMTKRLKRQHVPKLLAVFLYSTLQAGPTTSNDGSTGAIVGGYLRRCSHAALALSSRRFDWVRSRRVCGYRNESISLYSPS
jgi:hypothetical protein